MVHPASFVSTAIPSRERQRMPYRPPELLRQLHVLDFFELMGNQALAGQVLQLHQSSVSRIISGLSQQFDLYRNSNDTDGPDPLRYLRLAYRAHRMGDGVLRLASDPLFQPLLEGINSLQTVPPSFRPISEWVGLIHQGVIDGAIVAAPPPEISAPEERPTWQRLRWINLGQLELQLAMAHAEHRVVLVPDAEQAPLLHRQLLERQWMLRSLGPRRQDRQDWQEIATSLDLALPVAATLQPSQWLLQTQRSLEPLTPPLLVPLWLVMAEEAAVHSTAQDAVCRLQRRMQQDDRLERS